MPANENTDTGATYEAEEATVGAAQHLDTRAVRARAAVSDLLPPEALDERQAAIGQRRRRGGPPLEEEVPAAPGNVPPMPPTECEERSR
jgi:hypothetical protein